jgi:uncharacterized protein (TIGR02118 family)
MVKFTILFRTAAQPHEDAYTHFLAQVEQMPHVARRQVNAVTGSPVGESPYYRVLEVYFDDSAHLQESLNSPSGQQAGAALNRFPSGSFEMFFAEVYEESGGQTPTGAQQDQS